MSTRAQVKVQGGINQDQITLYRHCDGYPKEMLKTILKGYELSGAVKGNWEAARGGKAASFIIAAGVGSETYTAFEPENSHELHGDIEFYYIVTVGTEWSVQVYKAPFDCGDVKNMTLLAKGDIVELAGDEFLEYWKLL